ncbi:hypothetical protein D3C72_1422280 [compost metagenome]
MIFLDGDQTAAGVRRVDRHLYFFAGLIFRLVQLQFQFRIAIQRTTKVGIPGHAVGNAVKHLALRVFNHQHKIPRLVGRQPQIIPLFTQRQRLLRQRHFLHFRLIFVNAGILLGQHGNVFLLDQHQF